VGHKLERKVAGRKAQGRTSGRSSCRRLPQEYLSQGTCKAGKDEEKCNFFCLVDVKGLAAFFNVEKTNRIWPGPSLATALRCVPTDRIGFRFRPSPAAYPLLTDNVFIERRRDCMSVRELITG